MNQAKFQKQRRESARREKAKAKQERREARVAAAAAADEAPPAASEPEVLAQLAVLHDSFREGKIEFEEFEQRKQELMAQLDG
ncbi:MAG TPA: hypothetical protein VE487_20505 [Ilumatobacter sp.]|jgi:hypothetical protein|nr:hypothetical protein [Ilumatobacter sp.]